jgi:hypothetical protein
MAEVKNTIAIDFKVDTTALKAIKSQLDVFKSSLSGMSAPELFNISDSINGNINALQNQIATNKEVYNSLRNLTHAEMELNGMSKEDKSGALKLLSKESQTAAIQLRVAKDSAAILQQQLNMFGGSRANFEFINMASQKLGYTFNAVAKQMQQLSLVAQANGTVMNRATGQILTQAKAVNVLRSSMYRFNMNLLTVMFGSMAVQRSLTGLMRSAITTFQTANDESTSFGKATWELQAAWEFLKYSMIAALTQSDLFDWLIGSLLSIVNWLNELSPKTKSIIAIGIGIAIVAASAAVAYAQLVPLGKLIGATFAIDSVSSFLGFLAKAAFWAFVIYYAIQGVYNAIKIVIGQIDEADSTTTNYYFNLFKMIGMLGRLFSAAVTVMFISLVTLVVTGGTLLGTFFMFIKKNLDLMFLDFKILTKSIHLFWDKLWGDATTIVKEAINYVIDAWNNLISMLPDKVKNFLGISKIPKINIEYSSNIEKLQSELDSLKAERDSIEPSFDKRVGEVWGNYKEVIGGMWSDVNDLIPTNQEIIDAFSKSPRIPTTSTESKKNQNNVSFGDINIDVGGITEGVGADIEKITDQIVDKTIDRLSDELDRRVDSANN